MLRPAIPAVVRSPSAYSTNCGSERDGGRPRLSPPSKTMLRAVFVLALAALVRVAGCCLVCTLLWGSSEATRPGLRRPAPRGSPCRARSLRRNRVRMRR